MYFCQNLCERIEFKERYDVRKGIGGPYVKREATDNGIRYQRKYLNGFKRCNECSVFLKCDGINCPCCNKILMVSKRNLTKFRESEDRKIKLEHPISIDIQLNKDKWEALIAK